MKKKYEIIIDDIKSQIKNGLLKKGDKILTEEEYIKKYAVSRITVQTAMQHLKNDNIIYRIPGKGTFASGEYERMTVEKNNITFISINTADALLMLFESLEYNASKSNLYLSLKITNDDVERELATCIDAVESGTKGIIIFPIDENKNVDYFTDLVLKRYPIVFVDRKPVRTSCNYISTNNYYGSKLITEHNIYCGHKNIAYITSGQLTPLTERLQAFTDTMQAHGLTVRPENIVHFEKQVTSGLSGFDEIESAVEKLFSRPDHPTAVICCNDIIAINVIKKLRRMSLSVPDDVSVSGYDNTKLSSNYTYSLTTIDQNFYKIGELASNLLLRYAESRDVIAQLSVVPQLVIRNSVKHIL